MLHQVSLFVHRRETESSTSDLWSPIKWTSLEEYLFICYSEATNFLLSPHSLHPACLVWVWCQIYQPFDNKYCYLPKTTLCFLSPLELVVSLLDIASSTGYVDCIGGLVGLLDTSLCQLAEVMLVIWDSSPTLG